MSQVVDLACCAGYATESTLMDLADANWRDAEFFRETGRWHQADQSFRRALAEDAGAAVRIAYGTFLAERQDFRTAIEQLIQGLDAAQMCGNLEWQAVVLTNLAKIYRQLGDLDLARRFQRQVLALQGEAGAQDLLDWSHDALLAGKLPLAESLAQAVLTLVEDADDIGGQADAHGVLGVIAARKGQHRQAVSLLIRALRGHRHVDDVQGAGADYANLAEVCGLIGRVRWQQARFAAAAACFDRAGMPVSAEQMQQRTRTARSSDRDSNHDVRWN